MIRSLLICSASKGRNNTIAFSSSASLRAVRRHAIPIKNPYTGVVYANGQVPLSDPNIDPLALTTFKLLPTPNIPGAAITANNFQFLPASTDFENKGDGRADFVVNSRQNGFFRYSQRGAQTFQPGNIPGLAGGNSAGTLYARTRQLAAGYNWVVSTNSILELRFGQTWTQSGKTPQLIGQPSLVAGIPNVPTDPALGGGLNTQTVTGCIETGCQSFRPTAPNHSSHINSAVTSPMPLQRTKLTQVAVEAFRIEALADTCGSSCLFSIDWHSTAGDPLCS